MKYVSLYLALSSSLHALNIRLIYHTIIIEYIPLLLLFNFRVCM